VTVNRIKQRPIGLDGHKKTDLRTQFGAVCWRMNKGKVQIALVTGRKSNRWGIPKGWPMNGATPADAAATEAFEEAGLTGRVTDVCIGLYFRDKAISEGLSLPCVVAVFPLKVKTVLHEWPESGQRRRKWVGRKKATAMVRGRELGRILREFDPCALPE